MYDCHGFQSKVRVAHHHIFFKTLAPRFVVSFKLNLENTKQTTTNWTSLKL